MPAEWAPHAATWLAWPHNRDSWPGKFEPIPGVWARLARTLAEFEPVHILAGGEAVMAEARRLVGNVPGVTLHDVPTNDAWTRDHGPTFLVGPPGSEPALVDWGYNAWGGKYPPFDLDDQVPRRLARLTGRRRYEPGIILEGGAIDPNGAGALLTTEECLLNPNRNPHLSRQQIEETVLEYVGAQKMIWIPRGMLGDSDTSGHVDNICCFVRPGVVALAWAGDSSDPRHAACSEAEQALQTSTDARGRALQVVRVPLPPPQTVSPEECRTLPLANGQPIRSPGQLLPASYINFYFANGALIVPAFGDQASDGAAAEVFARLFPDRKIQMIPSREILLGGGNIHCITQQQPKVA